MLLRVVVNRVLLLASHPEESANGNRRALLANLAALEVPDQYRLEFPYGVVVVLDEVRKSVNFATDVNGGGGVWDLHRLEYGPKALVGLELLRHLGDHERARVERLDVLGRAEPLAPKPHDFAPVNVDEGDDNERDEIVDHDVGNEHVVVDVPDGEHGQDVTRFCWDVPYVVDDVDGDEDSACHEGDSGEQPTAETTKAEVDDGVEPDLLDKLGLLRVDKWRYPSQEGI